MMTQIGNTNAGAQVENGEPPRCKDEDTSQTEGLDTRENSNDDGRVAEAQIQSANAVNSHVMPTTSKGNDDECQTVGNETCHDDVHDPAEWPDDSSRGQRSRGGSKCNANQGQSEIGEDSGMVKVEEDATEEVEVTGAEEQDGDITECHDVHEDEVCNDDQDEPISEKEVQNSEQLERPTAFGMMEAERREYPDTPCPVESDNNQLDQSTHEQDEIDESPAPMDKGLGIADVGQEHGNAGHGQADVGYGQASVGHEQASVGHEQANVDPGRGGVGHTKEVVKEETNEGHEQHEVEQRQVSVGLEQKQTTPEEDKAGPKGGCGRDGQDRPINHDEHGQSGVQCHQEQPTVAEEQGQDEIRCEAQPNQDNRSQREDQDNGGNGEQDQCKPGAQTSPLGNMGHNQTNNVNVLDKNYRDKQCKLEGGDPVVVRSEHDERYNEDHDQSGDQRDLDDKEEVGDKNKTTGQRATKDVDTGRRENQRKTSGGSETKLGRRPSDRSIQSQQNINMQQKTESRPANQASSYSSRSNSARKNIYPERKSAGNDKQTKAVNRRGRSERIKTVTESNSSAQRNVGRQETQRPHTTAGIHGGDEDDTPPEVLFWARSLGGHTRLLQRPPQSCPATDQRFQSQGTGRQRFVELSRPKPVENRWIYIGSQQVMWGTQEMMNPITNSAKAAKVSTRVEELANPKHFSMEMSVAESNWPPAADPSYYRSGISAAALRHNATHHTQALSQPKPRSLVNSVDSESGICDFKNREYKGDGVRIEALSNHKLLPKDFQMNRETHVPVIGNPTLNAVTTSRVNALAVPKIRLRGPHQDSVWKVLDSAKQASPSSRIIELAKFKRVPDLFKYDRKLVWEVPLAARRAKPSARMHVLAKPITRIEGIKGNGAVFQVSPLALVGTFPARINELAQPCVR